jgi:hypothetical protein
MRTRNVARDCQPQPSATLIDVARIVEPHKGLEHFLALIGRNARPIIVDVNDKPAPFMNTAQRNTIGMAPSIGNKIP